MHTFSKGGRTWHVADIWAAARSCTPLSVRVDLLVPLLRQNTWYDPESTCESGSLAWMAPHIQRALRADLSYPVILGPSGDLLDGSHRILRCLIEGWPTIRVVKLHAMPKPLEDVCFKCTS